MAEEGYVGRGVWQRDGRNVGVNVGRGRGWEEQWQLWLTEYGTCCIAGLLSTALVVVETGGMTSPISSYPVAPPPLLVPLLAPPLPTSPQPVQGGVWPRSQRNAPAAGDREEPSEEGQYAPGRPGNYHYH